MGTLSTSCKRCRYARAVAGRSAIRRQSAIGSLHPGNSSTSICRSGSPACAKTGAAAAHAITRHESDSLEAGQHVELGDDRARQSVERDRVPRGDGIEPSATARASGHRSELAALTAQLLAAFVVQLRRQRARAHARAVGLEDADHAADGAGADAESRASAAGDRVRAGHVRIGAVADVEQRALSAFEQDPLPAIQAFVNVRDAVDNVGRQPPRGFEHDRPSSFTGCRR